MDLVSFPYLVTGVVGGLVLLEFFFNSPVLASISKELMNWGVIISAFALGLGALNLVKINMRQLTNPRQRSVHTLVLLVALIGYSLLGILFHSSSAPYKFVYDNLLQPLSATVFSFNAFFMTSAAYRAFRVKSVHATVLLVSALLMMLGAVGIGEVIYSGMPQISAWITAVFSTAGMRGFTIGAALGGIALSLRVILGLERSFLGDGGGGAA